jgi:hypothetical protein
MLMPNEEETKLRLEIGHVLFLDIVGYSKLRISQQTELIRELNQIVGGTKEFLEAGSQGKLVRLPTGDGMALVFRTSPEAPAQWALEISQILKAHPDIQLRMGIHSGPVNEGDIVAYSKLLITEQSEQLQKLNRTTRQYRDEVPVRLGRETSRAA